MLQKFLNTVFGPQNIGRTLKFDPKITKNSAIDSFWWEGDDPTILKTFIEPFRLNKFRNNRQKWQRIRDQPNLASHHTLPESPGSTNDIPYALTSKFRSVSGWFRGWLSPSKSWAHSWLGFGYQGPWIGGIYVEILVQKFGRSQKRVGKISEVCFSTSFDEVHMILKFGGDSTSRSRATRLVDFACPRL